MRSASRARGASNFNSIKVRLELSEDMQIEWSFKFQFHKGAIRTSFFGYKNGFGNLISIP